MLPVQYWQHWRLPGRVRDVLLGGRALVRQGRFVAEGAAGTYLTPGT